MDVSILPKASDFRERLRVRTVKHCVTVSSYIYVLMSNEGNCDRLVLDSCAVNCGNAYLSL